MLRSSSTFTTALAQNVGGKRFGKQSYACKTQRPERQNSPTEINVINELIMKAELSDPISRTGVVSLDSVARHCPRIDQKVSRAFAAWIEVLQLICHSGAYAHVNTAPLYPLSEILPPLDRPPLYSNELPGPFLTLLGCRGFPNPIAHLPCTNEEIHRVKYTIKMLTWMRALHCVEIERQLGKQMHGIGEPKFAIDRRGVRPGVLSHA